jgi:hypothetical protein
VIARPTQCWRDYGRGWRVLDGHGWVVTDPPEFDDEDLADWHLELDVRDPPRRPPEILTLTNVTEAQAHRRAREIATRRYSLDRLIGDGQCRDGSWT